MKQLPVSLLVKSILYDAVLQGLYLPDAACTHSLDLDVITLIVLLFCSDPRCLVFGDAAAVLLLMTSIILIMTMILFQRK